MAKVTKEVKAAVVRLDGSGGSDKETGDCGYYEIEGMQLYHDELLPHEKKMVVGLKPGKKRTVHLTMEWGDKEVPHD